MRYASLLLLVLMAACGHEANPIEHEEATPVMSGALIEKAKADESTIHLLDSLELAGWQVNWTSPSIEEIEGHTLVVFDALLEESVVAIVFDADSESAVYRPLNTTSADDLHAALSELSSQADLPELSDGRVDGLAEMKSALRTRPHNCVYTEYVGLNFGCVNLRYNPAGYYSRIRARVGRTRTNPDQPNWRADWRGRLVVCPGIEERTWTWHSCGFPRR